MDEYEESKSLTSMWRRILVDKKDTALQSHGLPVHCLFWRRQSAYLGIDPGGAHAHEEEAAEGAPDGSADEGKDVVDGPEFPCQETHADGDQAGHARCVRARGNYGLENYEEK